MGELEVKAFSFHGKRVHLAKIGIDYDMNPPINTLRTISEINRQNRLDLRLIRPEAAHALANLERKAGNFVAFLESRRFFDGCGAFPSSVLVCHNGLGVPLADEIVVDGSILGAAVSPIIHLDTRNYKGKPFIAN
ncbi:MAG: hypothetical protein NTX79_02725 [Candidatus Micrarchaeota archaeon]|nr:hypothetical protein [Candidatus Micrarchaeota archaeon]